jgi:peptidoglycan/xylan/chitin deacetylase (PgdA/CDA1 family)
MVEEGHELGNHMWTDYFSVLLTRSEFEKQFLETHRLLTTFSDVKWFRPGGGLYNRRILRRVQEEGYRVALGSVYPYDASHPLVSYSSWHVLNTVTPGSIIILHNATGRGIRTLQVLKQTLPVLLEQGYKFLTLSELSGKDEREVGFQD